MKSETSAGGTKRQRSSKNLFGKSHSFKDKKNLTFGSKKEDGLNATGSSTGSMFANAFKAALNSQI